MKGIADYAVVYDISSDKERAKVDKLLQGYGFRIQKSVFECRLTKKGRDELIEKLIKLDIKTGFIKVYKLEFSSRKYVIGKKKGEDVDKGPAFVI
ncbi:MAG: CRISPR-associated endonuclease Cas2 [Candidatus Omnitrophica bacterium]|nr:CRISPR-associated endonuclease Cas2 [Candidatus Omnitrophota bacterium]